MKSIIDTFLFGFIGKLFRSACRISESFKNKSFYDNNKVCLDKRLLHDGYITHFDFAQKLYKRYQNEMSEIIGSYGFSNEIDLLCCMDSCDVKGNERNDTQQTAKLLLKAVFNSIRERFQIDITSPKEAKARAAACYYVAYTDKTLEDKCMLSFPWLFASQLLVDEEFDGYIEQDTFNSSLNTYSRLPQQLSSAIYLLPTNNHHIVEELLKVCFQKNYTRNNARMIQYAENLFDQLMEIAKTNHVN